MEISLNSREMLQDGTQGWMPIRIVTNITALTNDGGSRSIQTRTPVGTARATEYTPAELANLVKGSNNSTGNFLLNELTNAYNDAIGGLN